MAKQIIQKLIDDLDGGDADENVRFAIDGMQYSIDLSVTNAQELRTFLARYVTAGERIRPTTFGPAARHALAGGVPRTTDRDENTKIRAWAGQNGYQVADRGRIPQEVVDAYRNRGTSTQPTLVEVAQEKPKPVATAAAPVPAATFNAGTPKKAAPAKPRKVAAR